MAHMLEGFSLESVVFISHCKEEDGRELSRIPHFQGRKELKQRGRLEKETLEKESFQSRVSKATESPL